MSMNIAPFETVEGGRCRPVAEEDGRQVRRCATTTSSESSTGCRIQRFMEWVEKLDRTPSAKNRRRCDTREWKFVDSITLLTKPVSNNVINTV